MNTRTLYRKTTETYEIWAPSMLSFMLRIWLAMIFFKAGQTKIASWDTTLALFEYEYQVPLLTPVLAAYAGTAVELLIPIMLIMGLFTSLSAAILFVLNLVAAISYPDISEAGMQEHIYWGILLTVPLALGGGRLSLDYLWQHFKLQQAKHVA